MEQIQTGWSRLRQGGADSGRVEQIQTGWSRFRWWSRQGGAGLVEQIQMVEQTGGGANFDRKEQIQTGWSRFRYSGAHRVEQILTG